ncbi:helix-turn-helix domain-containing protein [Streptococcus equinus]|uniref:helix-turn-helix domain-containing protein n=1 Tax=Streptococcus equinus TaxID=1335 RepID=UPI0008EBB2EC|nr:helix-turn-helix transcriptional regulator [Streptococcus equinus]QBX08019.1 hypothetical protein JavanS211_0002 [Streptococcus satellite phage Javan211]SFG09392.1 Helix-turn-helix [Streptococcus equinus]
MSKQLRRLKELRQEKGISLSKLSKILKEKYDISVSTSQLMYYEKGEREPRNKQVWEKLADFFEVTESYLLGYSDNRFSVGQIVEAISKKLTNSNEYLNKDILQNTMNIISLSAFLNMDLETLSNIYFYNLKRTTPMQSLSDLFDFFDSETEDYKELLSIVEPYQADEIIQEINKLGDYRAKLSLFLNEIRTEENFLQTTDSSVTMSGEPSKKVVKIDIPQNTLSDDELKELSPEERKKYISDYLDDLSNALSNLADFASTTANLSADQISKISDTLIQALAKLNNIKNKNKD